VQLDFSAEDAKDYLPMPTEFKSVPLLLVVVRCMRPDDNDEDGARECFTIASTKTEAETLCRSAYSGEGYTRYQAGETIEGEGKWNGPPYVIGYAGQGNWTWKTT
jgi:hypothetical protein